MGFMNPYAGLKRDDTGYYLDVNEATSNPFYKQYDNAERLQSSAQGGKAYLSSFDPYATTEQVTVTTGGDGNEQTTTGSPYSPMGARLSDAVFKGQAYGRADRQYASDQEVARIAQEGRDQTKQAQLSSEISYAQDAARRASMDQQRSGTTPGGPDVQLTTGDNGDATNDEGGGGTRRRRSAYQGSGLKI